MNKNNLHFLRKLNHSLPGLALFGLIFWEVLDIEIIKLSLLGLYFIVSFIEIFRLTNEEFNKKFCYTLKPFLRDYEKNKPTSTTFYLLSLLILLFFMPINVFYVGLLTLSIGDPMSSIIGLKYREHVLNKVYENNKSWFGCLTMGLFALIFSTLFLINDYPIFSTLKFGVIYSISLIIMERSVKNIDDNLYIPLLALISYLIVFII